MSAPQTDGHVGVVLISNVVWDKCRPSLAVAEPLQIHFPDYPKGTHAQWRPAGSLACAQVALTLFAKNEIARAPLRPSPSCPARDPRARHAR